MNPTIYYIRHGQTDWNAELRFQGQRDIPLNDTGRGQAGENGRRLADQTPEALSLPFVCSPMGRAVETMELVRENCGLPVKNYSTDVRLIEASYGDWEGQTLPEIKAKFPDLHRKRKKERWVFCPPGGESHQMLEARISDWYQSLNQDCVVVAHGVVGRVLRYLLLDLEPQKAGEFVFPQDKICRITRGTERFY